MDYDALKGAGAAVKVADPSMLKAIAASKKNNDHLDAIQHMNVWSLCPLTTAERHSAAIPMTSHLSPTRVKGQLRLSLDNYLSWMPHFAGITRARTAHQERNFGIARLAEKIEGHSPVLSVRAPLGPPAISNCRGRNNSRRCRAQAPACLHHRYRHIRRRAQIHLWCSNVG